MSNEEKLAQLKRELRWELSTLGGMADLPNYCKRDVRNKIRSLQSHIAKVEIEMGIRPKPEPKPKKSLHELWLEQLEVRRSE